MSVLGLDISSWQHPDGAPIDWPRVADAGYRFVLVKATQGVTYVNPWLARDLEDAHAAGLHVGAYHFYDQGPDAAEQAHYFVAALMGRHLQMYAWLDYEVSFSSPYEASQEVTQFLDAAHDGRPGCGLYCNTYTLDALRTAATRLPKLWVADPGVSSAPVECFAWQRAWNQAVPGIDAPTDVDELIRTRGVNLDTAPRPRPAAAPAEVAALQAAAHADEESAEPAEGATESAGESEAAGASA